MRAQKLKNMLCVVLAASGLNTMLAASRMPVVMRGLRTVTPRMLDLEEAGEFGTTDYTMTFKEGDKVLSP